MKEVINEIIPETTSIGINLNEGGANVSSSRKYMLGGFINKCCKIKGLSTRMITSGFEKQYGDYARKIVAPSNMTVVEIFYRDSLRETGELTNDWEEIAVVFFNDEKQKYDILYLSRYHTQNFYVGFEYVYDKEMLRRLKKGETFAKGEVFARSPGINENGEWMFGMDVKVAPLSIPETEEDGIVISDALLDRLGVMFEHVRSYNWNDTEYIPLNLYGDDEVYQPFPEPGQRIREDGLVMAFRRRDSKSAMVSLTNRALRRVDRLFDIKLYAPPGAEVKMVNVKSERLKDKANNKNPRKIMKHTEMLERYALLDNKMCNNIKSWYIRTANKYDENERPFTRELYNYIFQAYGNITTDLTTNKVNLTKRTKRNTQLLDWNIEIIIKEEVPCKIKFKLTDVSGGKSVITNIREAKYMPFDEFGNRAELICNSAPTFRRQIFTSLVSQEMNFINLHVARELKSLVAKGDYRSSWKLLSKFYETVSPEFYQTVMEVFPDFPSQCEHIDYVLKDKISVERRPDSSIHGAEIVRRILKNFKGVEPTPLTYYNQLNQPVKTLNNIPITVVHYLLLNKFGVEMSSESLSKNNLFGFPAKLNSRDKYGKWYRSVADRNTGSTESRIEVSAIGGEEAMRQLTLSYSPKARYLCIRRIMCSNDPMNIKEVVTEAEYKYNRATALALNFLTDTGYNLTTEYQEI